MKIRSIHFVALVALLANCGKNSEIKVYRVSKVPLEESTPQQQDAMPTNTAAPRMPAGLAPAAATAVTTPPNWEPQPLSQMRQASFLVKGDNGAIAEISFVGLGAAAGNVLDNVNRWLDQLGEPPITEQKLGEIAQRLTTSLGDVVVVDLAGLPKDADPAKDGRIIAAIARTGSSMLFFKMRGNAELTEAQKGDFIKWVAAVCNAQTETRSPQMAAMPPRQSGLPQIKWKTPESWTEVPPSSMRYASFSAPDGNGGQIDISVVTFAGDGGSDADNVNRWRGQIDLAPIDASAVTSQVESLKTADTTFSTTDIPGAKTRTIAAWTRHDGRVWFFKATGPSAAVEKEKPNFVKFIESVRF
ncbi:MAG: hypothetical protein DMF37_04435 [Verrucomicrobia bacterium]|nr:MAG: hypothetical protein DMF37_04435 [Verrucomicrobiota bacterium]